MLELLIVVSLSTMRHFSSTVYEFIIINATYTTAVNSTYTSKYENERLMDTGQC